MRNLFFMLAAALLLTGCDKLQSLTGDQAPTGQLVFEVNVSSPDNAVKTWWRYLDAVAKSTHEFCLFESGRGNKKDMLRTIATGEIESIRSGFGRCEEDVYGREILEVKQESDTRATLLAKITNETPTNLVPTAEEAELRKQGKTFKYLLEKDESGWKVAQVYQANPRYVILKQGDPWISIYKTYDKSYPASPTAIFTQL